MVTSRIDIQWTRQGVRLMKIRSWIFAFAFFLGLASTGLAASEWYYCDVALAGVADGVIYLQLRNPTSDPAGLAPQPFSGGGDYRFVAFVTDDQTDVNRVYATALTCISAGKRARVLIDPANGTAYVAPLYRFYIVN
jgi:hypothetical protein